MSDEKVLLEYEGPLTVTHWSDDWGTTYVDNEALGTKIAELLGLDVLAYEYKEIVIGKVRLAVEVIERDPPPPPPDPVQGFVGPLAPEDPST